MKIVIQNVSFPFDEGCRLLKMKYEECPKQFESILGDMWNDIVPMTFKEIATTFSSIEQRRISIDCLGLERLVKEINPILINKKTLKKRTAWVNSKGDVVTKKFNDTYELYQVSAKDWANGSETSWARDVHFVKCKDTSTDREYFIWIDAQEVYRVNDTRESKWYSSGEDYGKMINAIQAIAWTIQTDVPKGNIEKIIRQGDCVLIKPTTKEREGIRHLTEEEYKELLVLES